MCRFRFFTMIRMLVILTIFSLLSPVVLYAKSEAGIQYEALSPWGETDPKPLKGISPRLDTLAGKKIGLFANYKRAAIPIAISLKERLESQYPDARVSIYNSDKWNVTEIETEKGETFKKWVEGVDAIILMVGD
ncbi:MAG: hypothetical protein JXL81_12960 [Deltaproteobacteria bacterium]|nr:hypothetical protein [Deltaproteobacteria bacterium]